MQHKASDMPSDVIPRLHEFAPTQYHLHHLHRSSGCSSARRALPRRLSCLVVRHRLFQIVLAKRVHDQA